VRRRPAIAGLVALLLATGAAAQATHTVPPSRLPFQVDLPPGFAVEGYDGPDFSVYYLRKAGVTYLGAYDGFAPSFKGERPKAGGISQTVTCEREYATGREVLFSVGANPDWFIHAWMPSGLDEKERAVSERVLLSLRVAGKNAGLKPGELKPCG
jgi:hypothetical protein